MRCKGSAAGKSVGRQKRGDYTGELFFGKRKENRKSVIPNLKKTAKRIAQGKGGQQHGRGKKKFERALRKNRSRKRSTFSMGEIVSEKNQQKRK